MTYDVIVIGSGPAGYTAGIYSSRALLKTLIISGMQPGGQLTTTTEIENFPGFDQGILGVDLMDKMKKQAERFGITIALENAIEIKMQNAKGKITNQNSKLDNQFIVVTDKQQYEAKSIIIATGASPKPLGLAMEEKYRGKGVSYCATCDGFFYKGKKVVVVGGGDTAMEEANFLTRFADQVTIVHRRDEFRASPIMLQKAKQNPKITFLTNKQVVDMKGEGKLTGLILQDTQTQEKTEVATDGLFIAIGHNPSTQVFKGVVEMDETGYIITKFQIPNSKSQINSNNKITNFQTETSIPGIFAAGDCVDTVYRQAIVAAGMGCMAALDVQHYLEELKTLK